MKPRIFISAVTDEFKTTRQLVANVLTRLGYEPVSQDIFGTEPGDLRQMLREKIDGCDGLIQIVGHGFGAEPPNVDSQLGRVSYTQFEFLYARDPKHRKAKKTWLIYADEGCTRDQPLDQLDLPSDSTHPDPACYQAERRSLQDAWRKQWKENGHLRYLFTSETELKLQINELRDEFGVLRRGFRRWQIAVIGILSMVAVIAVMLFWQQKLEQNNAEGERFAQQGEREKQEKERLAAEAARQQAQKIEQIEQEFADRFLHQLLANKEISAKDARQRALRELPALVKLPLEQIQAIVDRKIPVSTPEAPVSPLDRARTALAQGKLDDVLKAADEHRQEGRELAMLEGTAALAKFRESPIPEWNERALAAFRRALASSDRTKEPKAWTDAAISAASLLHDLAKYSEAEPLLVDAQAILEKEHGRDSKEVAIALNNLAQLLQDTNRLAEAEPLMRRALAIDEQSYGAEHPDVAIALNNLAQLLQGTNRLAEAEPLMRRALAIDEQSYGAEHPRVAIDLNNLALLLQVSNHLAEAELFYRRALAIHEASLSPAHPAVAVDLNNMATLLQATKRLDHAKPLLRRALAIHEASFGPENPAVSIDLSNLAQLLKATKRLDQAEPLMRRTLAINEASHGPEHPNVAIHLNNLAHLLQATNRLNQAEPLMRRAMAIWEKAFGTDHPQVAVGLNSLALLLHATKRLDLAEPLYCRALAIDEQSYGAEHPRVAIRLNNLALLLQAKWHGLQARGESGQENDGQDARATLLAEVEPLMRRCRTILHIFQIQTGYEHPDWKMCSDNYQKLLEALKLSPEQIVLRFKEADEITRPLKPIIPDVERLLGPAQPFGDVLAALDRQYKADGKPAIYFLLADQAIAPHLDKLLGKSKLNVSLDEPVVPHLEKLLGPAKSTKEVFETLDREYREQNKSRVWFLPLTEPIEPHLDELLGPVSSKGNQD